MATCRFHTYLDAVGALVDATNRYIDVTEPFKLAKQDGARGRLGTILHTCAEAVRLILVYLSPVMPETMSRGLSQLGQSAGAGVLVDGGGWGVLAGGERVEKGEGLFPRKS